MKRARNQKDLSLISQIDWARLAAFIDGEGCISISRRPALKETRGTRDRFELTMTNTDVRLMVWLELTFGGSFRKYEPGNDVHKARYQWETSYWYGSSILQRCLPYLLLKREQAEVAIAFQSTMQRRGMRGTPQDVLDRRTELHSRMRVLNRRGPAAVGE